MHPTATGERPMNHQRIDVDGIPIHVVEGGERKARRSFLFVHGWPQDWTAFERVMTAFKDDARVVAIDLPGIGGSTMAPPSGDKHALAKFVRGVVVGLGLENVVLVGHDIGGQVAYAYLRRYPAEIDRAVLMDIAIPGIEPWTRIKQNPAIWHFAFHAIRGLPETLVAGRQAAYFDYFFDTIAATPEAVTVAARTRYAAAYERVDALRSGFDWYRTFAQDEKDNRGYGGAPLETPVLCLRGDKDPGLDPEHYVRGLRDAGLREVESRLIRGSGHFSLDEQPDAVIAELRRFDTLA
jgi:pimeloyl-ACP methyl ester carboxylesterase